jgi:integrase/recombinase XerC
MAQDVAALPPELQRFATHLEAERRASPHTRRAYLTDLAQYAEFLRAQGAPLVPSSPALVRAFVARAAASAGAASLGRKLSTLRSFYRFLVREGLAPGNPARAVASPRRPKRLPQVLPEEEVAALVEAPHPPTPPSPRRGEGGDRARHGAGREGTAAAALALRDRAFLELLYASGLRVSELTGLAVADVDLAGRLVRVLGKRRKERIVPFGVAAAEAPHPPMPPSPPRSS